MAQADWRTVLIQLLDDHQSNFYLVSHLPGDDGMWVASINWLVGDWAAYYGTSETQAENMEAPVWQRIATNGDKISQAKATEIFPWVADKYEWRD